MDERCADAEARRNTGAHIDERCLTCGHVFAVHGWDAMCDLCTLERRLKAH